MADKTRIRGVEAEADELLIKLPVAEMLDLVLAYCDDAGRVTDTTLAELQGELGPVQVAVDDLGGGLAPELLVLHPLTDWLEAAQADTPGSALHPHGAAQPKLSRLPEPERARRKPLREIMRLKGRLKKDGKSVRWDRIDKPTYSPPWSWAYRPLLLSWGYSHMSGWRNYAGLLRTFVYPWVPGDRPAGQRAKTEEPELPKGTWPSSFVLALLSSAPSDAQLSVAELRAIYADSLVRVPEEVPTPAVLLNLDRTRSLSDEALVDRLLNGIHPCQFAPVEDHSGRFATTLRWRPDELPANDGTWNHPDLTVTVETASDAAGSRPELVSITLDYSRYGLGERTWTPQQPVAWACAKHQARCTLLMLGQIDAHLGRTHLMVELAAWLLRDRRKAWDKQLRYQLPKAVKFLSAHLRDVDGVNHFGEPIVFAESGVLVRTSALNERRLIKRLARTALVALIDTSEPPAPRWDNDRYGRAAQLCWRAVDRHVAEQLKGVRPRQRRKVARKLVGSVFAIYRQGGLSETLAHLRAAGVKRPGRTLIRFIRGLCTEAGLQRWCTRLIYAATFQHTWYNDAQLLDGGDPHFATLGVKRAAPAGGTFVDLDLFQSFEAWRAATQPHPRDVSFQLFLAYVLTQVPLGYVARGDKTTEPAEWRDQARHGEVALLRRLRRAFNDSEQALEALGLPLRRLRSRVNT